MPDSLGPALADLSYILVSIVGLYAAYWAFAIRRRLMGRIYRNHALWLGVMGILVAIPGIPVSSNNPFINVLAVFYSNAGWQFLVVFAFIDSTIPVVRRSDPLLRDVFHWKKVRIGLWGVLAFFTIVAIYLSIYFRNCWVAANISACISSGISNSITLGAVLGFLGGNLVIADILPIILGALALLIGARRSRDTVLRESVKWLGVGLLCVGVGFVSVGGIEALLNLSNYSTTYSYGAVPWSAVLFLTGYAVYRSARSLAPLNRLPPIEPEISSSAKEATSQLSRGDHGRVN